MIYWNEQENPVLDFEKWDYRGVGYNSPEDYFKFKVKHGGYGYRDENRFKIFNDFIEVLNKYNLIKVKEAKSSLELN